MMKIVAGLGSLADYEKLVEAGADELFTGYVPFDWSLKYGNLLPLNRREVLFYHTHIGSFEDMKILAEKVRKYKVPVTIAINALYYTAEQICEIVKMVSELSAIGFKNFIVADINLIRELSKTDIDCNIHISGEVGQWNVPELDLFNEWFQGDKIKRIIFHRKNDIEHMRKCISHSGKIGFASEYEAFLMNEKCHYTGGFCNSMHCDELVHLCQLEYRLTPMAEPLHPMDSLLSTDPLLSMENNECSLEYVPGETGCGLCALYRMQQAKVTHLKIVGRGESADCMALDIKAVKEALNILQKAETEEKYISTVKKDLFENRCSGVCYYEDI